MNDLNDVLENLAEKIAAKLRNNGGFSKAVRLLNVEEAATYIGRSKAAMDHLIAAHVIPAVRADRRVMVDVQDLDKWIARNKT